MSQMTSKGFSLLEIMLVLAIFAGTALVVTMTLPDHHPLYARAEQMKTLMEYASSRATLAGRPLRLALTPSGYRFTILESALPLVPDATLPTWVPVESERMPMQGEFAADEEVALLTSSTEASQILFTPDGSITPFELRFSSPDAPCCTLSAGGTLPLTLTQAAQP